MDQHRLFHPSLAFEEFGREGNKGSRESKGKESFEKKGQDYLIEHFK